MISHVFKEIPDPLDGAEDKQHPKRIEKNKQDYDCHIDRLSCEDAFGEGAIFRDMQAGVKDVEHIHKPDEKNSNQNDLKEHEIKVAHQPLGGHVVPIADFRNHIFIRHNGLF